MDNEKPLTIQFEAQIAYSDLNSSWTPPHCINNATNSETVNKQPIWSETSTQYIAAGSLAALAFSYSPPANAGLGDMIKQLTNQFEEMFQPLLDATFGTFASLINAAQSDGSSGVMQSVAQGSDMIVKATQETANNKIAMASMPPPMHCESDDFGVASRNANISAKLTSDGIANESAKLYKPNRIPYTTRISNLATKYPEQEHITISKSLSSTKLDDSGVQAMIDGVDVITSHATEKIKLDPNMASSSSKFQRSEYISQSGKAARLEVAKAPFYDAIAERTTSSHGESKLSLVQKEIDRTYGGESEWRSALSEYADPTPLLAELNKQTSFSNYLLAETLKKVSQQNILIATQNIDKI
ncbi:hypothetical protein AB4491_11835 [Vibrio sp. 10N.261.45.A7]